MKRLLAAALLVASCVAPPAVAPAPSPATSPSPSPARPELLLATTTSTQDSGLLDVLVPDFEKKTGYKVKTSAVGTGAALAIGARGDADVVLVHAPSLELGFMKQGNGDRRLFVMHNDFIVVGPPSDPAKIKGRPVLDALKVTIDPTTKAETITNRLDNTSVSGTLSAPPTTPLAAGTTNNVTDLQGITATFNSFAALMATAPAPTSAPPGSTSKNTPSTTPTSWSASASSS